MAAGLHQMPFIDQFHKLFVQLVDNNAKLPRKCPVRPGDYYMYNLVLGEESELDVVKRTVTSSILPNGI